MQRAAAGKAPIVGRLDYLQIEHETEAALEVFHGLTSELAGAFKQEVAIDGHELGDVGDGVLRKPRDLRWNEDITGCVQQAQVGHEDHGNNGAQTAAIERIALHDDYGAPIAGLGTVALTEVCPPHLATFDYHESRGSERACARRSDRSRRLSSVA